MVPMTSTPLLNLSALLDDAKCFVDEGARRDGGRDDRLDRRLLTIGQHMQDDVATPLDQAEDRRLLLGQRAPARCALEPAPPPKAAFLATAAGWPLCPATT